MTHHDKDTELYDKAEELIEQKPEFAEGETYGEVTISDLEESVIDSDSQTDSEEFSEFNEAEELIENKPAFAEGETYGEQSLTDEARSPEIDPSLNLTNDMEEAPIFSDEEPYDESVPDDHEHDHPQEQIGLMPLNRINHPLR